MRTTQGSLNRERLISKKEVTLVPLARFVRKICVGACTYCVAVNVPLLQTCGKAYQKSRCNKTRCILRKAIIQILLFPTGADRK